MQNVKCLKCFSYTVIYHLEWAALICPQCKEEIKNPNTIAQQIAERFSYDPGRFVDETNTHLDEICIFEFQANWLVSVDFFNPQMNTIKKIHDLYVFEDGSYIAIKDEPFEHWDFGINKQSSVFCGFFPS